ncbi:LysR family transcriptional regulator [Burkholderia cepacia]|uniref:LysR family transcriptional regulator n=1 Tax=Burkholderia cepacia TaxID=292 RepID=UPI002AB76FDC|nr:LysR family transcriptional regulator [Burkholderia cepacia]
MIDLNEIYLFVEVIRAGSFAEASRRLGMPANSISRHIQTLESDLKSPLILRTTRKLTLTAVGQAFYDQCAQNIAGLVQASQEMTDVHSEPSGLLRVALPSAFFQICPVKWIVDFLSIYPAVKLEFLIDDVHLDLVTLAVDVAFRPDFMLDEHTVRRVIATSRRQLVAAPTYLASRGMPADLNELAQHDCLLVSRKSGPQVWQFNNLEGAAQINVNGRFLASSMNLIRRASIEGLGIALLPEVLVEPDISEGRLVRILDSYRSVSTQFCAVFPPHRYIRRVTTIFVDYIQSKISAMRSAACHTSFDIDRNITLTHQPDDGQHRMSPGQILPLVHDDELE